MWAFVEFKRCGHEEKSCVYDVSSFFSILPLAARCTSNFHFELYCTVFLAEGDLFLRARFAEIQPHTLEKSLFTPPMLCPLCKQSGARVMALDGGKCEKHVLPPHFAFFFLYL